MLEARADRFRHRREIQLGMLARAGIGDHSPSAPATMSPLRKVGSLSIETGARPAWSLPLQVQPATTSLRYLKAFGSSRIGLAGRRRGMIDVVAIDQFGLARRAEAVAGRRLALRVGPGDREIAPVAGPHAPGLAAATGDARARRLRRLRTVIAEREHRRCARHGRTRAEAAEQIGEEVSGLRRI